MRSFRRDRGLLALVVLTLAAGIGGTTAVFGVVDTLLLNPVPYANADRLVEIWSEQGPSGRRTPGVSAQTLRALREEAQLFSAAEAYQFGAATLTGDGEPELVSAPQISPGTLQMLGAVPRLGRLFNDDDAAVGQNVAIISEALWTTRFGRSEGAIGRLLTVDGEPYRIVGVLPDAFAFPERRAAVWRPLIISSPQGGPARVQAIVRLQSGITPQVLEERLRVVSDRLTNDGTLARDRRLVAGDLIQRRYARQYSSALYIMLGAIALVLLVACVNVTNLLLARATARRGEFALLGALGASRRQVVAQVLVESLLLAMIGGAAGLLVSRVLLATLLDLLPPQLTMLSGAATFNWRAAAFAAGLSGLTCVVVGLIPALRVARIDLVQGLKGRAPGMVDQGSERSQSALVVAQLALVLVLLAGTGLLLRSFVRLVNVDPGFDSTNLMVFEIQLPAGSYQAPGSSVALFDELDRAIEALPGVRQATFSEGAPPTGSSLSFDMRPSAEGRPDVDVSGLQLPHATVAGDYFSTMGIPLLQGRTFVTDDPEEVVIVNDVLAQRFWGAESPVGRRFRLDAKQPWHTVVGVARDVKAMGLNDPRGEGMELYFPYKRASSARFFAVIVRGGDPRTVTTQVKERLWSLDSRLPVIEAATMEDRLVESVARPRFFVRLSSAFAAIAVVLGAVGVYGTATYWVARRRRELGIRMALGATRGAAVMLVVGRSMRLAVWGCAIGIAIALATTKLMTSMLFETRADEPLIFVAVVAMLAGLVLAACYVPALRASRVDPATVLRAE